MNQTKATTNRLPSPEGLAEKKTIAKAIEGRLESVDGARVRMRSVGERKRIAAAVEKRLNALGGTYASMPCTSLPGHIDHFAVWIPSWMAPRN